MKAKYPKYYEFSNPNIGKRYFKVNGENIDVVQVIAHTQSKKGRPYQKGITLIKYTTFIGSWGWKMSSSRFMKQISKSEYEKQFNKTLKKLTK